MKYSLLVIYIVLNPFLRLIAQDKTVPPLATDRPDQTESAWLVPKGAIQFELGSLFEYDNDEGVTVKTFENSSLLIRYGLGDLIELRMNLVHALQESDRGATVTRLSGLRPLSAAVKLFVTEQKGVIPRTVFISEVGLPYGKKEYTPQRIVPSFLFVFANEINKRLGIGYSFGPSWEDTGHYEYFYSVVGGYSIADWLGGYVEFYGNLPDADSDRHLMDGGLTFLIRHNLQADISAGAGLNKSAADFFIGLGISWRIPR